MRKLAICICENKAQISFAVTAKLISAFVFATRIVQSLYFLNPKFQASSHLVWLYSPVCVGPGWKPRRPVFSQRGSYNLQLTEELIQNGYNRMKASVSIEDATHQSSVRSAQFPLDEAYIATAKYCDAFLRLKENGWFSMLFIFSKHYTFRWTKCFVIIKSCYLSSTQLRF